MIIQASSTAASSSPPKVRLKSTTDQPAPNMIRTSSKGYPWPADAIYSKFEASLTDEVLENAIAKLKAMLAKEEAEKAASSKKEAYGSSKRKSKKSKK